MVTFLPFQMIFLKETSFKIRFILAKNTVYLQTLKKEHTKIC